MRGTAECDPIRRQGLDRRIEGLVQRVDEVPCCLAAAPIEWVSSIGAERFIAARRTLPLRHRLAGGLAQGYRLVLGMPMEGAAARRFERNPVSSNDCMI